MLYITNYTNQKTLVSKIKFYKTEANSIIYTFIDIKNNDKADVKIVVNDKTIATLNTNNLEDLRTGLKEWVTLVYSKDLDNEIYTKYNLIEAILRNNIHHVGIHELPELLELLIQQL